MDTNKKTVLSIGTVQSVVSALAKEYGVQKVYLFGSYARGEATPGSDIDLRIDKGRIRGLEFAGFLGDLQDALGKPVDLISTIGIDPEFLDRIHKEEVLLYDGDQS